MRPTPSRRCGCVALSASGRLGTPRDDPDDPDDPDDSDDSDDPTRGIAFEPRYAPVGDTESPMTSVQLRAFCKEGLLSRNPTAKTAERVWTALDA